MKTMKLNYISPILTLLVILSVFSINAMAAPGTVTRSLPASVAPGATFVVTISPGSNLSTNPGWGIEENIPAGFTLIRTTAIGNQTVAGKQQFVQTGGNFTYTLTAPVSSGTYPIQGTFKDAAINKGSITGVTSIVVIAATKTSSGGSSSGGTYPPGYGGVSKTTAVKGGVVNKSTPVVEKTETAQVTSKPVEPVVTGKTTQTTAMPKAPGFESLTAVFAIALFATLLKNNRDRR
ncbi:MAG: hypothetical protein O8C61_05670 [Candidatus Methanoperedens sp.]|nr:hypothetical protein [Candidatus Methanoperedens sp.]